MRVNLGENLMKMSLRQKPQLMEGVSILSQLQGNLRGRRVASRIANGDNIVLKRFESLCLS